MYTVFPAPLNWESAMRGHARKDIKRKELSSINNISYQEKAGKKHMTFLPKLKKLMVHAIFII